LDIKTDLLINFLIISINFMEEVWKDIPNYDGYKVSNLGRVMGKKGWVLKQTSCKLGYTSVSLYTSKTEFINKRVSRLVALTFIPNPENKPDVDHINRITNDNRLENLRWVTKSENQLNRGVCFGETKGICWDKGHNAYKISITRNGKTINYGRRKTLEESIKYRDEILSR
jgi:hypothetical protein